MTVDFYKTDIKIEGMKVFQIFIAQYSNFELFYYKHAVIKLKLKSRDETICHIYNFHPLIQF